MSERVRVAIVGGGIAGLALGWHLGRRGTVTCVLEAESRPGGNIHTEERRGYRFEWGPNAFQDGEMATLRLVDALGLAGRLTRAGDAAGRRWIVRGGRLRALPTSPSQIFSSDVLSATGRARAALEWAQPARRDSDDESAWDFARRRFGREAADVLVDALVTGIYAGDARRLSVQAAFPRLRIMEREHGGLLKAMAAKRRAQGGGESVQAGGEGGTGGGGGGSGSSGSSRASGGGTPFGSGGVLASFDHGMDVLVRALADALGARLRCDARVARVVRLAAGWRLEVERGAPVEADRLVLACPSWQAAALVRSLDHELAEMLDGIPTAPVAVVGLGWHERDVAAVERGFGFLVPTRERLGILGTVYESWIFPHRAPAERALWRVMIGGARERGAIDLSDDALVQRALTACAKLTGVRATPEMSTVVRHGRGIPQYAVGHGQRLARIDDRLARHPGVALTGNSYRGVAMNACIREAEELAARLGDQPAVAT
jgi:oxygen-dependent protoporphyrinogen oxidase